MSLVHVSPSVLCTLDTVAVAAKSDEIKHVAQRALTDISMHFLPAGNADELVDELLRGDIRLAVLEVALTGAQTQWVVERINQIRPFVSLIVIAESAEQARAAKVEVGGCVYHLFTDRPSPEHLSAFLMMGRVRQRNQLAQSFTG